MNVKQRWMRHAGSSKRNRKLGGKHHMRTAEATDPDWESRAIRIAAALDLATSELQKLIDDIRERREKEDPPDGRTEH